MTKAVNDPPRVEAFSPRVPDQATTAAPGEHALWLPGHVFAPFRGRTVALRGDHPLQQTLRSEVQASGMTLVGEDVDPDLLFLPADRATDEIAAEAAAALALDTLGDEGFALARGEHGVVALYGGGPGAVYAWFALVRAASTTGFDGLAVVASRHVPAVALRMLDHWDNIAVHPKMGQVERGYSGGSIFYRDGELRDDLGRVERYARYLASIGINRVAINNVNVHDRESRLLGDDLGSVVRLAECFRPWGIRVHLSVNFASPVVLGGLGSSDPLDPDVVAWWADAAARVYAVIPDFGGFVVKADSEGQPGPFAYGRSHADGANVLARALAPYGGIVHWRAFVYNHRQDWRDRSTDRARAAFDHFAPLDGSFDDNVIVQVKHGPIDFQPREPLSPVLFALPRTRVAIEFQVTQEYTGQQKHAVYLGTEWSELLAFRPFGEDGPSLDRFATGGLVAVSSVGDGVFWTGHPLAQANLYAFGRLIWEPRADPIAVLGEWIALTFGSDPVVHETVHRILDESWHTFEGYTSPLGVGFMVTPHYHYDPSVDGYEYSPWGTYHFADRDGIGVDRTVATGTGYAGQYPEPWRSAFETPQTTPDELLLFFHHVPYTHLLSSGSTVIQHIYDTHFAGLEAVQAAAAAWDTLAGRIEDDVLAEGAARFAEQVRSTTEWRDQVNTYFFRASGIPDAHGRPIF